MIILLALLGIPVKIWYKPTSTLRGIVEITIFIICIAFIYTLYAPLLDLDNWQWAINEYGYQDALAAIVLEHVDNTLGDTVQGVLRELYLASKGFCQWVYPDNSTPFYLCSWTGVYG